MRIYLLKFFLIASLILLPNILHAGQSGDEVEENNEYSLEVDKSNNEIDQSNDNQIKIKIVDPFSKDLLVVKFFRKDLSTPSIYPVSSMKLVGTILSDDPDNFALIKLPGDDDQIIVKQGQTIGKFNAIVKKIEKDLLVIEENKKILTLELDE
ncbi:pilus assembly protein PilP [Candidatus Pelagibacter ubique]|jgi:type II secretory pathway component PulC|nr:pilus assembly protein PilP [Candidatus Pelagibacter ubique]MDA7476514.1 pilus assembly protein PilP [Candidatus Pelagibacter ubique]MDC0372960.1 pilus assembly protein PilP [Candidatus Pelagibacter ubique]MDC0531767.1 pilus assembly protein PilP [Candidatus Pelagibacter ubique]MDC0558000.1 pilus assembly protein PilP [Candidatus Pelagibacter ubique]